MQKRYVVRLTDQERSELQGIIKKLKGTGQKVRRAQICLKPTRVGRIGRMNGSPMRFRVGQERSRKFGSAWLTAGLKTRSTALSEPSHRWRNC